MTKIDRIITKNFLKLAVLALVGFVGIAVLTQLNRALVRYNDGTLTLYESFLFLISEVPRTASMMMPITTLLAAVMTINKMATNSEIVALKTSGVSFKRIIKFPMIAALILGIGIAIMDDNLSTKGRKVKRELKTKGDTVAWKRAEDPNYDYTKDPTVGEVISSNAYIKSVKGDYLANVQTVYEKQGLIDNLFMIYPDGKGGLKKIIVAQHGKFDRNKQQWIGENVYYKDLLTNKDTFLKNGVIKELLEKPSELTLNKFYMDEERISKIRENAAIIGATGGETRDYVLEMNKRIANPVLIFIISFFGFALGSRYVRGGAAISIAFAIVLGFSTYVVKSISEAFVSGGHLSPVLGAWLPCIIFAGISFYTMNEAEY